MHDIKVTPKLHQVFCKNRLVFDLIAQSLADWAEVDLDIDTVAFGSRRQNVLLNKAFVYVFEDTFPLRFRAALPDPIIL